MTSESSASRRRTLRAWVGPGRRGGGPSRWPVSRPGSRCRGRSRPRRTTTTGSCAIWRRSRSIPPSCTGSLTRWVASRSVTSPTSSCGDPSTSRPSRNWSSRAAFPPGASPGIRMPASTPPNHWCSDRSTARTELSRPTSRCCSPTRPPSPSRRPRSPGASCPVRDCRTVRRQPPGPPRWTRPGPGQRRRFPGHTGRRAAVDGACAQRPDLASALLVGLARDRRSGERAAGAYPHQAWRP